ncbi:hypothetical protein [Roseivirga misakiensis]|uniref:hypothetical protein n=1 Tax=Roseivirga misakiensis TaxID=1563681 RepID=UPI00114D0426|nr:hypothetical protein [Roseivirga misakiensis]
MILLFLNIGLKAQIINKDYIKVKTIERDYRNQVSLPFYYLWNEQQEILIIGFDFKPSKFEVFETKTWKRLSYFQTRGHSFEPESFFSPKETNVVYIKKNRGKTLYKVDYLKGVILEKTSIKKLDFERPAPNYESQFYDSYWQQNFPRHHYLFFEDYALIIKDSEIDVYKRD